MLVISNKFFLTDDFEIIRVDDETACVRIRNKKVFFFNLILDFKVYCLVNYFLLFRTSILCVVFWLFFFNLRENFWKILQKNLFSERQRIVHSFHGQSEFELLRRVLWWFPNIERHARAFHVRLFLWPQTWWVVILVFINSSDIRLFSSI